MTREELDVIDSGPDSPNHHKDSMKADNTDFTPQVS